MSEITTWPHHPKSFYNITTSAITFQVKASGNAAIGLTEKPDAKCDYWIVLVDRDNRSGIRAKNGDIESVVTAGLLSVDEYRSFWLTWHGGNICLGREGEQTPFVKLKSKKANLSYITFYVHSNTTTVYWKFELPPVRNETKIKPIEGGDLQWTSVIDQLPYGALIGGMEKEKLFIIRGRHRGSLTPGKFVPSEGVGYIAWGGEAHAKEDIEVLCGYNAVWVSTSNARIPAGAVLAGHSENVPFENLYVGRAFHEGHVIPGKIQPSHKCIYIPYQGKEITKKKYEILVTPQFRYDMRFSRISESDDESYSEDSDNDNDVNVNDEMYFGDPGYIAVAF